MGSCVGDIDLDVRTISLSIYNPVVKAEVVPDAGTCSEVLRNYSVAIGSVGARELHSASAAIESWIDILVTASCIVRRGVPWGSGSTWVAVAFEAAIDHWVGLTA